MIPNAEIRSRSTLRSTAKEDGKSELQGLGPRSYRDTPARRAGSNSSPVGLFRLPVFACLLLSLTAGLSLTGCFGFLKPAKSTSRHFLLSPLPAAEATAAPRSSVGVGVGSVKLAAYLFNASLVVRRGTNEIEYLPSVIWAERLDTGLQRVLAANLTTLLPTDRIRLSSWQTGDVSAEVYATIERFDVDARGQGVLVCWWRVLSPGGENTLKAGETRLTCQGPPPDADPAGAVATLSELAADLSRQLAKAIHEATAPQARR
jgi:uncharacterized protein